MHIIKTWKELPMSLLMNTARYWLFESAFGSIVEVSRDEYPTYISAIAEARQQLINGWFNWIRFGV